MYDQNVVEKELAEFSTYLEDDLIKKVSNMDISNTVFADNLVIMNQGKYLKLIDFESSFYKNDKNFVKERIYNNTHKVLKIISKRMIKGIYPDKICVQTISYSREKIN